MTTTDRAIETKGAGQYADVNGINLYYETHGTGRPIVLLHGGLGSGEMFGPLLPALAAGHQVIVPDLQGHGRTADIDRPIDVRLMGDDIAALIGHLGLGQPDVVGYSLGGGVAFFTAVRHPEAVGKLVMVSTNIRRDAIYPEMLAQQLQVGAGGGGVHEGHADVPGLPAGRAATGRLPAAAGQDGRVDGPGLRLQRRGPRAQGADAVRLRRRRHVPAKPRGRGVRAARRREARRRLDGRRPAGRRTRARDRARHDPLQRLHSPALAAAALSFIDAPAA